MERLLSLVGFFVFLGLAWGLSEKRKEINWRLVIWGVGLQVILALLILKTRPGLVFFEAARVVMTGLLDFSDIGARFLFGSLVNNQSLGATVAFKVLPTVIFVSSLMGVLFYLRVIQAVVHAMAWVMRRTMRASGAESLLAAMFVFMGIESMVGLKDYISRMTRSEIFTIMTCFLATIAGSVMAVYVSFGADAGHLLAASVMSAPAAMVLSKLLIPELETPLTGAEMKGVLQSGDENIVDAAANGAMSGLRLAASIGAILMAFVALIGMLDYFLGFLNTSFESASGYAFAPVAFIMGVPWKDCLLVGQLLGVKVIFNEFLSYQKMGELISAGLLEQRSVTIATYALCSFANFGSIAILIGAVGAISPERKRLVASLSLKALLAGLLASFMTASIAGILL